MRGVRALSQSLAHLPMGRPAAGYGCLACISNTILHRDGSAGSGEVGRDPAFAGLPENCLVSSMCRT
jgi:hypothetical protein